MKVGRVCGPFWFAAVLAVTGQPCVGQQPPDSTIYRALFADFYRGSVPQRIWVADSVYRYPHGALAGSQGITTRLGGQPDLDSAMISRFDSLFRMPGGTQGVGASQQDRNRRKGYTGWRRRDA